MIRNTLHQYGWLTIIFHWLMALAFIAMYALGLYMVDLDYYDSLYHQAPNWHKSTGILLVALMLMRFIWNRSQTHPSDLGSHAFLNRIAHIIHNMFYLLVALLLVTGYLISTAKGKGVEVFEWFTLPALLPENSERGDLAGNIHEIIAHIFIFLALTHAGAAVKHHFIDKDATLVRMLRIFHKIPGDTP